MCFEDDAVSLSSEISDPQLEVPAAGVDDLPASPPASEPADAGDDEGEAPIVKRRRLEPAVRSNAVLIRVAAARRCAAQMQQAVRNRTLRARRARPVVPTHPPRVINPRAQFNAAFFHSLRHSEWFIPCDQAFYGRNNCNVIWLFFCSICGAHAFHPPAPKLQKECEGPTKGTNGRRVLAALRSGKHPDSRPPYQIGTPGPLCARSRIFVDPFPMLPKSGGSGRRGVDFSQLGVPSSGSGPSSSQPNVLGRGKRDLTPVPQPIDFLSAYGKPKAPRIRSLSPNPYDHPPPLDACQPPPPQTASENSEGRVCGAVEVVAIDLCEVSPSLEGPASTELAQVIDASGESCFRSPSRSPLLPPSAPVFSAQDQQPSPLHDAPPSGVSSAMGIPVGGSPEQVDTTDVGVASLNSNMNSVTPVGASGFLICIGCSTSFVPIQGEECYGKCQECLSSFFEYFCAYKLPLVFFFSFARFASAWSVQCYGGPLGGIPRAS